MNDAQLGHFQQLDKFAFRRVLTLKHRYCLGAKMQNAQMTLLGQTGECDGLNVCAPMMRGCADARVVILEVMFPKDVKYKELGGVK